jgi:glyoxylase-like metal-dependent hydrolase (beta-lactamase superfamily II)
LLTKLNDKVAIIDTQALGHARLVAAYLVTGKETALIDMGYQSSAEILSKDLTAHGIQPDGLDYLLPTHVHLDHSGSCGALAKKFPKASIIVHPKGEPHLVDPSLLWNGASELFGDQLMALYGRPEPVEKKRLRVAGDDDVIDLGDGQVLRTVWTPGHASHHLSYEWEEHHVFFTGDSVGIYLPDFPALVPTTPPPSFDLQQTLRSLERIQESQPSEFYTPHYGVVANDRGWVAKNVESLQRWKAGIEEMHGRGFTNEQVSERLTEEIGQQIGQTAENVPDYLRVLVRANVIGFVRYLERQTDRR